MVEIYSVSDDNLQILFVFENEAERDWLFKMLDIIVTLYGNIQNVLTKAAISEIKRELKIRKKER